MITNQHTFLFYDLETTGMNHCFDQIIEFAAIRTDLNFNEISRHHFYIKIKPDVVPNINAIFTHQLSIQQINDYGLCEYEAISKIYNLFNTCNTISIGYNSLNFDDKFLQFSFYRNLLCSYKHFGYNGCFRIDIYPIVIMYYLYVHKSINFYYVKKNMISFKLEHLNIANNFVLNGKSHNALFDVLVTISLAQKLKTSDKYMWEFSINKFIKMCDKNIINDLDYGLTINNIQYKQALLINGSFGYNNKFIIPALYLGQHKYYLNQHIFLRLDKTLFPINNNYDVSKLVINKKISGLPFLLPIKNKYIAHIDNNIINIIKYNKMFYSKNINLFHTIKDYYLNSTYNYFYDVDLDAKLYLDNYNILMKQYKIHNNFHMLNWSDKIKYMKNINNDSMVYSKLIRIVGRYNYLLLNNHEKIIFNQYLSSINNSNKDNLILDYSGKHHYNIIDADSDLKNIDISKLDKKRLFLYQELKKYLNL